MTNFAINMKGMIIGAGQGLSRAIALLFGEKGFSITLVSRNEEKLAKEARRLTNMGIKVDYAVADAGNEDSLQNVLNSMIVDGIVPDFIVYNAYVPSRTSLLDETWDSLRAQLDVNVGGTFNLLKTMIPVFEKSGKGKIFVTGGGYALHPGADSIGVSIGKAAQRNLTIAAAQKVADLNIHIATVTICGVIDGKDPKYASNKIAEKYWELYNQASGKFESEIVY